MLAFLADMPIPQNAVIVARELGHDAIHVRDYDMQRARDELILERALSEGRIILTMDLGFSREVALSGEVHPGLIVFRLGNVTAQEIAEAFRRVLSAFGEEEIRHHILIVEPDRVRRRALPVEQTE